MDLLAARVVMLVHFGFLAYVVLGGFLALRWPRTLVLHLAAVAWGLTSVLVGVECPLTALEAGFRARAGAPPLTGGGFIDHYLQGVVFPERYTPLVLAAAAVVVLVSWVRLAVLHRSGETAREASDADRRCRS